MSQRFRRNIAPVLVALLLMVLGIAAWALYGASRTEDATRALHAHFAAAGAPWAVALPDNGYAVFEYRDGEARCATLSLLPEAASLLGPAGQPRTVARAEATTLLDELARLAADCERVEVRVFASRIPWHGRFTVRYAGGEVQSVSDPVFGQ